MRAVRGIHAAEDHRVRLLVAGQRFLCGAVRFGDRVADLRFRNALDGRCDVTDLACGQAVHRLPRRREHADLGDVELAAARHHADARSRLHGAVKHAHIGQRALVVIIEAVEDQAFERRVRIAGRRGDGVDDPCKDLAHVLPRLCRNARRVLGGDADDVLDLLLHALGLGTRQIDLVHDREHLKSVVDREVDIGKRLRLNALRRVHDEHRAFACGKRARDLIVEVDVTRRVDQVEHVGLAVGMVIEHAHGGRLDRDAALALDVHGVQKLLLHVALGDGVGQLHHAVRERRFAVVDVRNDRKVTNEVGIEIHKRSSRMVRRTDAVSISTHYCTLPLPKLQGV